MFVTLIKHIWSIKHFFFESLKSFRGINQFDNSKYNVDIPMLVYVFINNNEMLNSVTKNHEILINYVPYG